MASEQKLTGKKSTRFKYTRTGNLAKALVVAGWIGVPAIYGAAIVTYAALDNSPDRPTVTQITPSARSLSR